MVNEVNQKKIRRRESSSENFTEISAKQAFRQKKFILAFLGEGQSPEKLCSSVRILRAKKANKGGADGFQLEKNSK